MQVTNVNRPLAYISNKFDNRAKCGLCVPQIWRFSFTSADGIAAIFLVRYFSCWVPSSPSIASLSFLSTQLRLPYQITMGNAQSEAVESVLTLLRTVKTTSGLDRITALKELGTICKNPDYKKFLCTNEQFNDLLPTFRHLLITTKDDKEVLSEIIRCLMTLSVHRDNHMRIASRELKLIPVLMNLLTNASVSLENSTRTNIEATISNCSMDERTHEYLFSSEIDWLTYISKRFEEKPNDICSFWWINNLLIPMSNDNLALHVINNSSKVRFFDLLFAKFLSLGPDTTTWSRAISMGCLVFLMIMSEKGKIVLLPFLVSFLLSFLSSLFIYFFLSFFLSFFQLLTNSKWIEIFKRIF
jgi:hypothetical protein